MAININMQELKQVIYDGNDCNGFQFDEDLLTLQWRKPYTCTFPTLPTGVEKITVSRSTVSTCQGDYPTSLTATGTVLYDDTVTVTATPKTGYKITTQPTFKSGVTNGKVKGAVTLNAPVAERTLCTISLGNLAYGAWRTSSD